MNKNINTIILLGSGGHTAEMIEVVEGLDKQRYYPRHYILAKSDKTSEEKIRAVEAGEDFTVQKIFRSRRVKQSYITSIFTTLLATISCIPLILKIKPDMVLCNGPGTCIPICLVAFILQKLRIIPKCKIIFIESYCRVKNLSLSGKILLNIADLFVVQWPELLKKSKNVKYYGKIL